MKKIYIFFILIALFVFIFGTTIVSASSFTNGLTNAGEAGAGYSAAGRENPITFLGIMFGSVLKPGFIGVIAMIILSYGGYTWMMARGDEQKVEKAKAIISNTIIALIVVLSTYVIVTLIIPLWTEVVGNQAW
jgi:hypothetical protein